MVQHTCWNDVDIVNINPSGILSDS